MASSNYRMNVIWTSHGAQLQRDINNFIGQFNSMGGAMNRNSRQLTLWGQQMKAIGTTIRYALAGATVYAVATAVSSLGEFENKLGVINSLAAKMGGDGRLQGLGQGLERLGDHALRMSNKFGIAVDDIQQHMIGFYSTFDAPEGAAGLKQLREFVDAMSRLTLISEGADPAALSRGLASMSRNPQTGQLPKGRANELGSAFAYLIAESTIRGEDIARDVGRLAGGRVAARMTPEEILGVYLGAAKAGGSIPVVGRGVAQLVTASLVNPKTPDQKAAFMQAVGTTDPTALRALGGTEILRRMMRAVAPGGGRLTRGQQGILGNEDITDEDALGALGQTRGINLTLATQLFGRQESLRVFLNLLSQGGPRAMEGFIKGIKDAEKANSLKQRSDIVNERRWYQQLSQAQRNIGLTFSRGLEPFFRPVSGGVRRLSNEMIGHPTAAVAAVGGVAAAQLASKIALGVGLGGLLGRGLGRIPGLRRFGAGNILARAPEFAGAQLIGSGIGAFQATGIGATRSGSRENPFWVVIDPQSWFFPGAPSGQGVAPQSPVQPRPFGGRAPGGGAKGGRPVPLLAGRIAGPVGIAALLTQIPGATSGKGTIGSIVREHAQDLRPYPRVAEILTRFLDNKEMKPRELKVIDALFEKGASHMFPKAAQRVLLEGEAKADITVRVTDAQGRQIAEKTEKGVPVKLWNQGNPQFRGRQRDVRRERRGGQ